MLRLFSAIALTFLCGMNTFAGQQHYGPSRLGGAMVTWRDNRLSAELKDAPVKKVLEDLMESEGFACQVTGDLQGTISMTIDHLTVEETLHKVMRNRRYDHTMILAKPESPDGSGVAVSELTIYQGDKVVRFVKVPKGSLGAQSKRVESVPKPVAPSSAEKPVRTKVATGEELEQLDREIKSLMDEMLTEEKMSQQEYDEALQTFSGENR